MYNHASIGEWKGLRVHVSSSSETSGENRIALCVGADAIKSGDTSSREEEQSPQTSSFPCHKRRMSKRNGKEKDGKNTTILFR